MHATYFFAVVTVLLAGESQGVPLPNSNKFLSGAKGSFGVVSTNPSSPTIGARGLVGTLVSDLATALDGVIAKRDLSSITSAVPPNLQPLSQGLPVLGSSVQHAGTSKLRPAPSFPVVGSPSNVPLITNTSNWIDTNHEPSLGCLPALDPLPVLNNLAGVTGGVV